MEKEYTRSFYDRVQNTALQSAAVVVDVVMEMFHPRSVADIGCGTGAWLRTFAARGVSVIRGYDAAWMPPEQLLIPREAFIPVDLSKTMPLVETCDLAISLEVGEHLPEPMARPLVECLCAAAPVVLFSAAIPGQGGTHHINLQWHWYWRGIFRSKGFGCVDAIRPLIWGDSRVDWVYRQNAYLFVAANVLNSRRDLARFKLPDSERPLTVIRESILERCGSLEAQPWPELARALLRKLKRQVCRRLWGKAS